MTTKPSARKRAPRRNADLATARSKPLGAVLDGELVTYGGEEFRISKLSADAVCALAAVTVASQDRAQRKTQAMLTEAQQAGRQPDFDAIREAAWSDFLSRRTLVSVAAVVLDREREWADANFDPIAAANVASAAERQNPGIAEVVRLFIQRAGLV